MAGIRRPVLSQPWEEDECLEYYGMLSLHRMFEVIGSQLTENDIQALSFMMNESSCTHPLASLLLSLDEESDDVEPNTTALLRPCQRRNCKRCVRDENSSCSLDYPELHYPKNGTEFLLELERRGKCDESNFTQLLNFLRVLTRHDLLPYVTMKKSRPVSPERYTHGPMVMDSQQQMDGCLSTAPSETREENWETGSNSNKRKRGGSKKRSRCPNPKRKCSAPSQTPAGQNKVTCGIRLRVRAEYCQHDSILNQNVLSVKQNLLEKQFDLFSQSNTVLKSRDLGSIICDIKFSELSYLDAFWTDYMNGSLLEALKGVFITDSLKEAVGQETIQLLVNVDEDDYEEGRRLLMENIPHPSQ